MPGQAQARPPQVIQLANRADSGTCCISCVICLTPHKGLKSPYTVICCYFNYGVSIYIISHHAKGQILGPPPITRKYTLH